MTNPLVSVIIVNWNGGKVLERCLSSVFAQTFREFEVILVDNASTDKSLNLVENFWPSVRIICMDKNIGFAAANNTAARSANGKWLALLNSDAFPEPDWLQVLIDTANTRFDLCFFASCQIQADAPDILDGTGDQYHIGGVAWRRQHGQRVDQAMQVMDEVFSACGASAFYPRDAFLGAGGFDESFFSYFEDVDLGFRLRLLGYRCFYIPDARLLHVGSSSLGKESQFAIYHTLRNMVWTFFKNMPASYFWKYLPIHAATSFGYSLYYALCCCPLISLKAAKDALLGLPSALHSRKQIQSNIRVDPREVMRAIHSPLHRSRNPLGLFVMIPKMLIGFILAVRKCRKQRQMPDQDILLKEISTI